MATLTITISDALLASLKTRAVTEGKTPEAIAAADLESWEATYADPSADAFLKLSGCINSGLTDVGERHDYYLGEALATELRNGKSS